MGFKEKVNDTIAAICYGNEGTVVGCIAKGVERATVKKSDLLHGVVTVQLKGSDVELTVNGHLIHEPIMPQVS